MALTDKGTLIAQKIIDIIDAKKADFGIDRVYYGDQLQIPTFPAVCVESFPKDRIIRETGKPETIVRTGIIVYFAKIQSSEINIKKSEELTEDIEDELHKHRRLDGLIVHGFIERVDPGVALKNDVFIKATRLIWRSTTKVLFPAQV